MNDPENLEINATSDYTQLQEMLMDTSAVSTSPASPDLAPAPFRDLLSDAIRYWEPRRIAYNGFLALIVLGLVVFTWPHFQSAFTAQSILALFVLAVLANVCYCAAYIADVPMQYSSFRDLWRRRRWMLFCVGALFAGAIAFYWIADEIYPSVSEGIGL